MLLQHCLIFCVCVKVQRLLPRHLSVLSSSCLPLFLFQVELEFDESLGIQVPDQDFGNVAYSYHNIKLFIFVDLKYTFSVLLIVELLVNSILCSIKIILIILQFLPT